MKCPQCGYWNRASFPRCFRCGAELPQADAAGPGAKKPSIAEDGPSKIYIQINEEGKATSSMDRRDQLAKEMEDLAARKRRGEEQHRRLRENSAKQGLHPSSRAAQAMTGRNAFPIPQNTSYIKNGMEAEGNVRPDAIPVVSRRVIGYDETAEPEPGMGYSDDLSGRRRGRKIKIYRHSFFRRYGRMIAAILVLIALAFVAYDRVYKPYVEKQRAMSLQAQTIITPSILNEMPAHIIRIPGEEGQIYWITELKASYAVVGGYATIEVPDYKWYENTQHITEESVIATRTSAGEQKQMEQITFQVDIPESTLELVNPSTTRTTTYTKLYNIQFRVARNSTVTINNNDYSDLVNNQDGLISYNAQVNPVGDNVFEIKTRAQYCREKSVTIVIYREPQEIPLDLDADIATRYSPNRVEDKTQEKDEKGKYPMIEPNMKIRGKTLTWANIKVLSPHVNLDLSKMPISGEFAFEAIFDRIGTNQIIIEASAPGFKTSKVIHEVYYIPIADIYTRKAWSMKDQYTDYLNNSEKRIEKTQIYQCDGTITEIIATNPQIAVMELSDGTGRTILVTNYSYDTWKVGSVYKLFGDAYGIYNGTPWLNGRYSYIQNEPTPTPK